jgi:hypothetical protein
MSDIGLFYGCNELRRLVHEVDLDVSREVTERSIYERDETPRLFHRGAS